MNKKVTIKIPEVIYQRIRNLIEDSGFNSPTDFIVYVLRDLVGEKESPMMEKREQNTHLLPNIMKESYDYDDKRVKGEEIVYDCMSHKKPFPKNFVKQLNTNLNNAINRI